MVRPVVTCGTDITYTWNQGSGSMIASLAATATNSPTSWEWTILSVPTGLESLLVGTYGDFTNAVALIQNPILPVPTAVAAGSIVIQCRAANGPSPSDMSNPAADQAAGQQVVGIQDINGRLYPSDFEYDWGQRVLDAVLRALPISHQASHVTGSDPIPIATTGAPGLLPVLGAGTTNFLRADGTWNAPSSGSFSGREQEFTAATGDQTFTLGATPATNANMLSGVNIISVFRNGQRLRYQAVPATGLEFGYTAPTFIVCKSLIAGDIITVVYST